MCVRLGKTAESCVPAIRTQGTRFLEQEQGLEEERWPGSGALRTRYPGRAVSSSRLKPSLSNNVAKCSRAGREGAHPEGDAEGPAGLGALSGSVCRAGAADPSAVPGPRGGVRPGNLGLWPSASGAAAGKYLSRNPWLGGGGVTLNQCARIWGM